VLFFGCDFCRSHFERLHPSPCRFLADRTCETEKKQHLAKLKIGTMSTNTLRLGDSDRSHRFPFRDVNRNIKSNNDLRRIRCLQQIAKWIYQQTEDMKGQVWVAGSLLRPLDPSWAACFVA
jgi:hypothetical protein